MRAMKREPCSMPIRKRAQVTSRIWLRVRHRPAARWRYASQILDVTWARFLIGIEQGSRFIARMFPPNVAADKLQLLYAGMTESLQIAVLATVIGIALSLPLGPRRRAQSQLRADRLGRAHADRAVPHVHPVIIAILFVRRWGSARSRACSRSSLPPWAFSPSSSPRRSRKCR